MVYVMDGYVTLGWLVLGKFVCEHGEEGMTNESRNMVDGLC